MVHGVAGAQSDEEWLYTVEKGDNPWTITSKYLDGIEYWRKLVELNGLTNPTRIPVGSQIRIPLSWVRFEDSAVIVLDSIGAGTVSRADGAGTVPLARDLRVAAGDRIRIPGDGSALLLYPDRSRVYLSGSSELLVERVETIGTSTKGNSRSLLEKGSTEIDARPRGTRFEITTPSANTAVRGTKLRVRADESQAYSSRIEVVDGSVDVSASGQARRLSKGHGTLVEIGKPPAAPVELLPAPTITRPGQYTRDHSVTFTWTEVAGASSYRVKIRPADDRTAFLVDEIANGTRLVAPNLPDNEYVVLVRAVGDLGLEGFDGRYSLEIDAQPQPPVTISPRMDEIVYADSIAFEWSRPQDIDRFVFELSRDPEFVDVVLAAPDLADTTFSLENIEPGRYFWRVTSKTDIETGPPGTPRGFELRSPLATPAVSSSVDKKILILHWDSVEFATGYRVQMADSADFESPTVDEAVDSPQWQTRRPRQTRYFRVRAIGPDGFEGAWSAPQELSPAPMSRFFMLLPIGLYLLAL